MERLCYCIRDKMATAFLKGTRKTYSFEERKILISLINKYEIIEDKKLDPISICKRKSAWSQIAKDYNTVIGPQGTRSAVQLRRCWENMKACKRNREEKRIREVVCPSIKDEGQGKKHCWEGVNRNLNTSEAPTSIGTVGLPPNVVFEPKDSEPFTLQSVCTVKPPKVNCPKKDLDNCEDLNSLHGPVADGHEKSTKECVDSSLVEQLGNNDHFEKNRTASGSSIPHILISPSIMQEQNRKKKFAQREEELHMLALSEARMKVDIAAMLKEEARIKLEEAHYRKEEARLRMLLFTYKLDRMKED